jgi:probable rRNA maturation factor
LKITIINEQSVLKLSKKHIQNFVRCICSEENVDTNEIIINFIEKEKIKKLHKHFFDDDTVTDCISFPIDSPEEANVGYSILGEIYVCPSVAIAYSEKNNISSYDEVALYIIHGILHLIGYKDITEKEQRVMRKKEKKCMDLIKRSCLGLCEKHRKALLKKL